MADADAIRRFDEGVAFVAGGSGGIGAAITRAMSRAGSDVVFTYYRNRSAADQLVTELARPGYRVEACQLALEDAAAVAAAIADARARFGRIHSVVYAAGPVTPVKSTAPPATAASEELGPVEMWRDVQNSA